MKRGFPKASEKAYTRKKKLISHAELQPDLSGNHQERRVKHGAGAGGQLHAPYIKTGRGQLLVSRNQEGEKEAGGFSIQIMKDEERKSRTVARLKITCCSPTALLGKPERGWNWQMKGKH